jgi:hypothetical protein
MSQRGPNSTAQLITDYACNQLEDKLHRKGDSMHHAYFRTPVVLACVRVHAVMHKVV